MALFTLSTDSTSDLTPELLQELQILDGVNMSYMLDGKEYTGLGNDKLTPEQFYAKVRAGSMPKTSMVNEEAAYAFFSGFAKPGLRHLHIAFSSALSGTADCCKAAAARINAEVEDCTIAVVDSKCASMGEGLLCYYAAKARDEGKSLDEAVAYIEELKENLCHYFTVDDLNHLKRGGRVSGTAAFMGTLLKIKPVLHVDPEGRLIPLNKVIGRKKSLTALVDKMESKIPGKENKIVFISHGDCLEDAKFVGDLVTARFGITDIRYGTIGPVIGAHSGPGTVALFFVGNGKEEKK